MLEGEELPGIPEPIPAMEIPEFQMEKFTSVWSILPEAVKSVQPVPFEALDQNQGYMLYKTTLIGHKNGKLKVTELHDFATVFLNGIYIGTLDRREGINTIDLPLSEVANPVLEILVEGMGHINFAQEIIDRKGITDRVSLNGMTLMNWEIYKLPMNEVFIKSLQAESVTGDKPGIFFKGVFTLKTTADTYFDMSWYKKGVAWVNGHCLGRYWEIGPQKRLYCPASWLNAGENEVVIFDLLQSNSKPVKGEKLPE